MNIPDNLTYTASWGPFSLTISQSTNIHVSCKGWQNGVGVITPTVVVDPPYFDQDQFAIPAQILQIPSLWPP